MLKLLKKLLTLSLLFLMSLSPAWADSPIDRLVHSYVKEAPFQIRSKDGIEETIYVNTLIYVYRLEDGSTMESTTDLSRKVEDDRPIQEKHPKLYKFQRFCNFANPILVFVGLVF